MGTEASVCVRAGSFRSSGFGAGVPDAGTEIGAPVDVVALDGAADWSTVVEERISPVAPGAGGDVSGTNARVGGAKIAFRNASTSAINSAGRAGATAMGICFFGGLAPADATAPPPGCPLVPAPDCVRDAGSAENMLSVNGCDVGCR